MILTVRICLLGQNYEPRDDRGMKRSRSESTDDQSLPRGGDQYHDQGGGRGGRFDYRGRGSGRWDDRGHKGGRSFRGGRGRF